MRTFSKKNSYHRNHSIEAHDLSLFECKFLSSIITNNDMLSEDYKHVKPSSPFLQGYREPHKGKKNGWVLVEFWTNDFIKIQQAIDYINKRFSEIDEEIIKLFEEKTEKNNE